MTVTTIALKVCASALKCFPSSTLRLIWGRKRSSTSSTSTSALPWTRIVDCWCGDSRCGQKNIVELAAEMTQLSKKARDRKLTPEEMEGGTFTITNLGGIGGTGFSPIVNHPEVAILGFRVRGWSRSG